jgi:hypothetical protein
MKLIGPGFTPDARRPVPPGTPRPAPVPELPASLEETRYKPVCCHQQGQHAIDWTECQRRPPKTTHPYTIGAACRMGMYVFGYVGSASPSSRLQKQY